MIAVLYNEAKVISEQKHSLIIPLHLHIKSLLKRKIFAAVR